MESCGINRWWPLRQQENAHEALLSLWKVGRGDLTSDSASVSTSVKWGWQFEGVGPMSRLHR